MITKSPNLNMTGLILPKSHTVKCQDKNKNARRLKLHITKLYGDDFMTT